MMTRPADVLMAAHLAKLSAAERRSAEYVERNNDVQHYADALANLAAAEAAWIAQEERDRRRDGYLAGLCVQCPASTTLGQHTWRCAFMAGHNRNHHANTTAGATIVWPQAHV